MRKVVFAINITADGYCGHEDGIADDQLLRYFSALLRQSDTILFGRKTYELMVPFWPDIAKSQSEDEARNEFARVFDSLQLVLFSRSWKSAAEKTRIIEGNLENEVKALKKLPGMNISVGSLSLASQLSALNLIDEYHFVVHPVVAGRGPRLFESQQPKEKLMLRRIGTQNFESGAIATHYRTLS
ncbi:MAG: dihydrofolate reductase family protein [Leptospiraceae bacterium]|nr:dihydrofolate reductase family protein [Leptospiraceae bacterium]